MKKLKLTKLSHLSNPAVNERAEFVPTNKATENIDGYHRRKIYKKINKSCDF